MFTRVPLPVLVRHATAPRLMTTVALAGTLLAWTPDVLANATPDTPPESPPPVCDTLAPATVVIDAGDITNTTIVDLSADGGTAIGDSSGGDENLATTGDDGDDNDKDKDKDKGNDKKDNNRKNDRNDREDDSEVSAAGNGGVSDAGADGGAIAVENVNSGGNVGSAIAVGDTYGGYGCGSATGSYGTAGVSSGGVFIDGGTVTNETIISVSADGGTAIADASGGDNNIASNGGSAGNGGSISSSAGNGGIANASADGGAISIGDINSGGNAGNAISVGDTFAAPVPVCCEPPSRPVPVPITVPGKPLPPAAPGKVVIVTRLPSTGEGTANTITATTMALMALTTGLASLASRRRMA